MRDSFEILRRYWTVEENGAGTGTSVEDEHEEEEEREEEDRVEQGRTVSQWILFYALRVARRLPARGSPNAARTLTRDPTVGSFSVLCGESTGGSRLVMRCLEYRNGFFPPSRTPGPEAALSCSQTSQAHFLTISTEFPVKFGRIDDAMPPRRSGPGVPPEKSAMSQLLTERACLGSGARQREVSIQAPGMNAVCNTALLSNTAHHGHWGCGGLIACIARCRQHTQIKCTLQVSMHAETGKSQKLKTQH